MENDRVPWLRGHVAVDVTYCRLGEDGVDAVHCVSAVVMVLAASRHNRRHAGLHQPVHRYCSTHGRSQAWAKWGGALPPGNVEKCFFCYKCCLKPH